MDFKEAIKQALPNVSIPHVLKNFRLPWPIFESDFETWCRLYDAHLKEPIRFDVGPKEHHDSPCWERYRAIEFISMSEFFEKAHNSKLHTEWLSYSYKDIQSWPEELKENISFDALGFEDAKDILFWIGSQGANTPCHYDSYGFNIVVQVFGRKRWLLFPPDTPMDITRVPYEESSVYCKQNFYSPKDMSRFAEISNRCHEVILHPGEILIVPNRWFHYVECLDETLAINTWIPMEEEDSRSSLEECFVRNFILQTVENLNDDLREMILNPNEIVYEDSSANYPKLSMALGQRILDNNSKRHKRQATTTNQGRKTSSELNEILKKHSIILSPVELMPSDEFIKLISENSRRYKSNEHDAALTEDFSNIEQLINAICHPKAMQVSCELYLNSLKNFTIRK